MQIPHTLPVTADQSRAARFQLGLTQADLIHLLYYRVWFLKLAPRLRQKLGLKPRPLWRLWIRSRF